MAKGEQVKKGMDAVIEKVSKAGKEKRRPALKRKGPGIAIMIAVGKPKPGMGPGPKGEMRGKKGGKAQQIAALEEKIGYLKAELALLKGDDDEMAMGDESEDEYEADDESEDED